MNLKATLEQWRMFKAVVEAGGFNQAAEQVHKSQSSIHHAVQKLESALGLTLFLNEGRRVTLTEAGDLMYRRACYLLDEAHKIESVANSLKSGVETYLRIAVDIIFPPEMLYKALNKVSQSYPLLRIELMETVLNGANTLLKEGEVDLGISPFPLNSGFSEDLCEIDFIAVAHPSHPLHTMNRVITLEDLKGHRQIVVRDSSTDRKAESGWLGAEQRWTVSHVRTSIDIIRQGLGFAWLPLAIIRNELETGVLKPLPLDQGGVRKALLFLCFADGDRLGPAARAFLGELRYQTMSLPSVDSISE